MADVGPGNNEIADALERIADLLEAEGANPFRIRSYRRGAATVRECDDRAAALAGKDPKRLEELPGIGSGLAGGISLLRRLRPRAPARRRTPGTRRLAPRGPR